MLELGASIIHGQNQHVLSLARQLNLTLTQGDDTGSAFQIWSGKEFVFAQVGGGCGVCWYVRGSCRLPVASIAVAWLLLQCACLFFPAYYISSAVMTQPYRLLYLYRTLSLCPPLCPALPPVALLHMQTGRTLPDMWAVAKRYGVTPLR